MSTNPHAYELDYPEVFLINDERPYLVKISNTNNGKFTVGKHSHIATQYVV